MDAGPSEPADPLSYGKRCQENGQGMNETEHHAVKRILSFDRHFDGRPGIGRLTHLE